MQQVNNLEKEKTAYRNVPIECHSKLILNLVFVALVFVDKLVYWANFRISYKTRTGYFDPAMTHTFELSVNNFSCNGSNNGQIQRNKKINKCNYFV